MVGKIGLIVVLCVACVLAEVPVNHHYRGQRLRQLPQRQFRRPFFARQEAAPAAQPKPEYGAPPSTESPAPEYGAPPAPEYGAPPSPTDAEPAPTDNPDSEVVSSGQPSRLTQFQQRLPKRNNPPKFQRLELQQEIKTLQPASIAPARQLLQPIQLAPIQQEGSYFIQLPSGSVQRVTYLTQPSYVDNSLFARLQFRPVAEIQPAVVPVATAPAAEGSSIIELPQLRVNTQVQSFNS